VVDIPFPISTNPGKKPQEGTGRLINIFAEPRGDNSPVWRRAPGAVVFARTPSSGSASLEIVANARGQMMFSSFEFVGSNSTGLDNTGSTAVSLNYPTGTAANDLVVLVRGCDLLAGPWVTPTGFTLLTQSTATVPDWFIGYKLSTGEQTVTVTAGGTGGHPTASLLFSIRGADQVTPIDSQAAAATTASTGGADPPATTTLTTAALVVAIGIVTDTNNVTITAPASYGMPMAAGTTAASSLDGCVVMAALYLSTAATANNPSTFTNTGTTVSSAGYSFAIKRA
jgi:hypothetical protein